MKTFKIKTHSRVISTSLPCLRNNEQRRYPLSTNDSTRELLEHGGRHRDAAIEDENYYIMHEYVVIQ